jgi:hypothetical protein
VSLYIVSTDWNLTKLDAARPIAEIMKQLKTQKGRDQLFNHDFMLGWAADFQSAVEQRTGQPLYPCVELNINDVTLHPRRNGLGGSYSGEVTADFLTNLVQCKTPEFERLTRGLAGVNTVIDYTTNFGAYERALKVVSERLNAQRIDIRRWNG